MMATKKPTDTTSDTGTPTTPAPKAATKATIKGSGKVAKAKAPAEEMVRPPSHPMAPNANNDERIPARQAGRAAAYRGLSINVRLRDVAPGSEADKQWLEGFKEVAHPTSSGRVVDIEDGYTKDY